MHGGGGGWGHSHGGHHGIDRDESLGAPYDHRVVTRLGAYTRPYGPLLAAALASTLVYAVSHAAGPRIIGIAIDHFIAAGDATGLSVIAAVFLGNGLITLGAQYGQSLILTWVGQRVLHALRTDLFKHLQKLSLS
ncbi:MAG: ABC transporter transmembrane domain-containing protein, partial [Chloroflexota bacterium]